MGELYIRIGQRFPDLVAAKRFKFDLPLLYQPGPCRVKALDKAGVRHHFDYTA